MGFEPTTLWFLIFALLTFQKKDVLQKKSRKMCLPHRELNPGLLGESQVS